MKSFVDEAQLAAEEAEKLANNRIAIIAAAIAGVVMVLILFIYLSSCIIIVKQGTRKIVERFGSYNRTLKEGLHIIFRPFDKIAPVPWNVLSISERDAYERNRNSKVIHFYNDSKSRKGLNETDAARLARQNDRLVHYIAKKLNKDIRILVREDFIDRGEDVSAAYGDGLDYNSICKSRSGKNLNQLIDDVTMAKNSMDALTSAYKSLGINPYKADEDLVRAVRDKDALAASVKYYPRHQDPHSVRAGFYPMAEHQILDYVDLRERHIDTSSSVVRNLLLSRSEDEWSYVGGKHGVNNFDAINLITKDNASIGANIVIFFSITDPFLYYYGVDQPEESLTLLAITTLRNIVSGMTLEEALNARRDINKQIRQELDIATNNWGIKANRVEIKDFELASDMQEAMDDVLIAEREKRANILRAQAYKKMKDEGVMEEHMKLKGLETLQEVSKGSANKVFIPNDLGDFITGAHVVADAFGEAKKEAKVIKDVKPVDKK